MRITQPKEHWSLGHVPNSAILSNSFHLHKVKKKAGNPLQFNPICAAVELIANCSHAGPAASPPACAGAGDEGASAHHVHRDHQPGAAAAALAHVHRPPQPPSPEAARRSFGMGSGGASVGWWGEERVVGGYGGKAVTVCQDRGYVGPSGWGAPEVRPPTPRRDA
jgi:hypothetical protein